MTVSRSLEVVLADDQLPRLGDAATGTGQVAQLRMGDIIGTGVLAAVTTAFLQSGQRGETNEVDVRLNRTLVAALFGGAAHLLVCWHLDVHFATGLALLLLVFATATAVASVTIS